jgi:hypothetical protein
MENRFITVIDRHGEKRRVKREEHLTRLRLEREFGDLTRFEGPTKNYSNESESSNSEPNNTEGSYNNQIINREKRTSMGNNPTPSSSENLHSPHDPRKKKKRNKPKGNRKSRRKGKHTQNTRRERMKQRKIQKNKTKKGKNQIRKKEMNQNQFNSNQ